MDKSNETFILDNGYALVISYNGQLSEAEAKGIIAEDIDNATLVSLAFSREGHKIFTFQY